MADMMIKGYDPKNIHFGNTLSEDQLPFERFNYCARTEFFDALNSRLDSNPSAPKKKLLQKHLGEHDPEAEVCKTRGATEPDPDLRDNENVPLGESVDT